MGSALFQLFGVAWVMPQGERVIGKLGGIVGQPHGVALMEDGSIVFDVVSLARAECTQL